MEHTIMVVSAELDEPEPKLKVDNNESILRKDPLIITLTFVHALAEERRIFVGSTPTSLKDCPWLI
jgi:hypothetical protein